ncbi:unnamed protein product [Pylaiella littoralis]
MLVSEPKTETMCMLAQGVEACSFTINAAGMAFRQKKHVYHGGEICKDGSIEDEINHLLPAQQPGNARPSGGGLRLKVRLLQAEAVETLLYGCVTWRLKPDENRKLRTLHHFFLLRCIGWNKR